MEKRIRYQKVGETKLISNREFSVGEKIARVEIDLTAMKFSIVDNKTNETVKAGQAKTPHSIKKAVKAALAELGVQFGSENRDRKKKTEDQQAA